MTSKDTHEIVIAGGGIGGLCLAHGLRGAGLDVRVLERTHARTDWLQGYRIHIDPHGATALHHCLSPAAWKAFLGAVSDEASGFAFRTESLAPLLEIADAAGNDPDPARRHHGISRTALREALLTDLDGVVEHGATVTGYDVRDGRVDVHVDGGEPVTADLLVGADGANSAIRGLLVPGTGRLDTGAIGIAGKHRLAPDTALPDELLRGAVTVIPRRRGFLFSNVWRGDHLADRSAPDADDYVFWAFVDAATTFPSPDALRALPGEELREMVGERITDWSPHLQHLVAGSAPDTVHAVRMRSAAKPPRWTPGPVTLLGDAVHNMTPMAGVGANTALGDAALLTDALVAVRDGRAPEQAALADYQQRMLDHGFRAVATSHRNAVMAGSHSRVRRAVARTVLRALDHVPAAKRRMLA